MNSRPSEIPEERESSEKPNSHLPTPGTTSYLDPSRINTDYGQGMPPKALREQ